MTVYLARATWTFDDDEGRPLVKHLVKIGYTDGDPLVRLGQLRHGTPAKVELVDTIPDAPRPVERELHRQFDHLRVDGEWFRDRPEIREAFKDHRAANHREHLQTAITAAVEVLDQTRVDSPTTGTLEKAILRAREALDEHACGCVLPDEEHQDPVQAMTVVRAFWAEFRNRFAWDLLPFPFLYDLQRAWLARVSTGSPPMVSRQQFVSDLVAIVRNDPEWHCPDKNRKIRPRQMIIEPEPLIAEYRLENWYSPNCAGDPSRYTQEELGRPKMQANYRGLLRRQQSPPAHAAHITRRTS
ncbi:MAG: GIY-YIG nuclease family protein [Propionibacteriaceae bacterium]